MFLFNLHLVYLPSLFASLHHHFSEQIIQSLFHKEIHKGWHNHNPSIEIAFSNVFMYDDKGLLLEQYNVKLCKYDDYDDQNVNACNSINLTYS